MNEMNDTYSSTAEAIGVLPPKKPGRSKLLIGVAALCAVAAVAVAVKMTSARDPKATVEAAFTATAAQQKAAVEKIYQKIPAAKRLFENGGGAARTTDFDFTVKSIEDNPYAPFANVILKDAGIRGSFASDPAQKTAALNASVYLKDAPMLEARAFMSPELIAAGVPTFSNTIVSFNPTSFAQDYAGSALGAVYPLDTPTLELAQGLIIGEMEYINAIGSISSEKLQADMLPILKGALTNAAYTYDKQSKKYVVEIPNDDLKAAILNYYRYIYFESELGAAIEKMMGPIASATTPGQSYEDMMNAALAGIEESLPEMDAVLALDIQNGLIKTANLTCTPVAADAASSDAASTPEELLPAQSTLTSLILDFSFGETANTAKLVLTTDDATSMTVDVSGALENDAYTLDMTAAVDSDYTTLNMPLTMHIAADGAYACTADITVDMGGQPMQAGVAFNGTAVLENDTLTLQLPDSRIYGSATNTATGTLIFDLDCTSAPLTEALTPFESTPLFALNAQQLGQLGNEYSVGYENLVGQLFSLLMG